MRYRSFGTIPWKVSALGLGCTRLPVQNNGSDLADVDQVEATRMIRHAIDSGVNYVDTAYGAHGGKGEAVLGQALRDGYRARVHVATKLPLCSIEEPGDFDRILDQQLKRLECEAIDCYLFQSLNRQLWRDVVLRYGLLDRAAAAIADGRIHHLGFSFHNESVAHQDVQVFEEILTGSDLWSLCQIEHNYLNIQQWAGSSDLRLAADRGVGGVAIGPLQGGILAVPPAEVRQIMDEFPLLRTPTEWALEWLWDQPELSTVLSGMSCFEYLEENLHVARQARLHCFGTKDQTVIEKLREGYSAHMPIAMHQDCCLGRDEELVRPVSAKSDVVEAEKAEVARLRCAVYAGCRQKSSVTDRL